MDLGALKSRLGPDVAAVMITNPNTCDLFEPDMKTISDIATSISAGAELQRGATQNIAQSVRAAASGRPMNVRNAAQGATGETSSRMLVGFPSACFCGTPFLWASQLRVPRKRGAADLRPPAEALRSACAGRTAAIRDRFLDVEARRCDSPRCHTPPGRAGAPGEEVTNMHDEDLKLIRQIVASDGRKYTAGNIDRSRYDRLVDLGWLTPFKTNISDVEYQATEKGRAASRGR